MVRAGDVRRWIGAAVGGLVQRAVLAELPSDGGVQAAKFSLTEGDVADGVEVFEPYGLTSRPGSPAEAVVLSVGGDPANLVAVVVGDRRFRLQGLAAGEVALYNDGGAKIVLKADGSIEVVPKLGSKIKLGTSPSQELAFNQEIKDILGDITTVLTTLNTAWAATTGAAWPADWAILKPAWTGLNALILSLVGKITLALGTTEIDA